MLQDAVDDYLASLSLSHAKRRSNTNTVVAYRNDLYQLCHFLQTQGKEQWAQVEQEDIEGYVVQMREELAYRPTTISRKFAALKSFFHYIQGSGLIQADPIPEIKIPPIAKDMPHILTEEEMHNLFLQVDVKTFAGLRDLAMLHVLSTTGLRVSELVALNVDEVDEHRSLILCPGPRGQVWRERALPLPQESLEVVEHYLQRARPKLVRRVREQALFVNHHGERLTRQGFWLIVKGYAKAAGIADITPQILRRSFAALMLKDGMPLRSVQELLGHAHVSTTQIYNQLVQDDPPSDDIM